MKKTLQRFVVLALALGLITLQAFGPVNHSIHAQGLQEDGILTDIGEGENRVLTSNWVVLGSGAQVTYRFVYDGDEQPITVWMSAIPSDGANFQIWTDERLEALAEDAETEPLGQGTAADDGSGFTTWIGGSPEAETYYVVVTATGDTVRFLLNITSPALAADQPGAVEADDSTPVPQPTAEDDTAVVTTDTLNVREGPAITFTVITTVSNGTELTVLGRDEPNDWLLVQLEDGTEGWVTRTLTDFNNLDVPIITETALPTPTPQPGIAATITSTAQTTTTIPITNGVDSTDIVTATTQPLIDATTLEGEWLVLAEGETAWYTVEYLGGGLPLTLWLDMDPFADAELTVVDAETAATLVADSTAEDVEVIGRGIANPIEPGYLFWRASTEDAGTFYVLIENVGEGDVLYSLHALGAGVDRTVAETE